MVETVIAWAELTTRSTQNTNKDSSPYDKERKRAV